MPGGRESTGTGRRDWTVVCHHSVGGDGSDLGVAMLGTEGGAEG